MDPMKLLRGVSTSSSKTVLAISPCPSLCTASTACLFGPFREAKHGSLVLIEPVGVVFHPVFVLYLDVHEVGSGQLFRRCSRSVMAVDIHRHKIESTPTAAWMEGWSLSLISHQHRKGMVLSIEVFFCCRRPQLLAGAHWRPAAERLRSASTQPLMAGARSTGGSGWFESREGT